MNQHHHSATEAKHIRMSRMQDAENYRLAREASEVEATNQRPKVFKLALLAVLRAIQAIIIR